MENFNLVTMKIISWNVNGLQGILKKTIDGKKSTHILTDNTLNHLIATQEPDILCLQEIRCSEKFQCSKYLFGCIYTNYSKNRKGYSGTLICSKILPLSVAYDFDNYNTDSELNSEGRIITLEYTEFYLVNVYVPNSKPDFSRLSYRINVWEKTLRGYLQMLGAKKKIILIGDLNCIATDLDIHNSLSNLAGNHKLEREAFSQLLEATQTIDCFRQLNPHLRQYTWHYPYTKGINKGCRLDYCLISKEFGPKLLRSEILSCEGSDHWPISVVLDIGFEKLKIKLKMKTNEI